MRKSRRIILSIILVTLLAGFAFLILRPREPIYAGRTLSSWLEQLDDGSGDLILMPQPLSLDQAEAANAMRLMGTKTVPYLLRLLTYRDTPLKTQLLMHLPTWPQIHIVRERDYRRRAIMAFDALGPIASDAIPELTRIFLGSSQRPFDRHRNVIKRAAANALAAVGPAGWEILSLSIKSTNHFEADCAIAALLEHHAAVPGAIEIFMDCLTNRAAFGSNPSAGWALGAIGRDQKTVLPFLTNALQSPDPQVRWGAVLGLGAMGTNAISALPLLRSALNDTNTDIKMSAQNALDEITRTASGR